MHGKPSESRTVTVAISPRWTTMRTRRLAVAGLLAAGMAFAAIAQGAGAPPPHIGTDHATTRQPAYRKALLDLLEHAGAQLDAAQIKTFRTLLVAHGWPTVPAVGRKGVDAAARLTLRARSDYPLQSALENLAAHRVGFDVDGPAFARWNDCIEFHHDGTQQLGSLVQFRHGTATPKPPVDVDQANRLRDDLGLPLLARYLAHAHPDAITRAPCTEPSFAGFATRYTPYTRPALRHQLGVMVTADQNARMKAMKVGKLRDKKLNRAVGDVDKANLPKLKKIFGTYGIPSARMVGRDGVSTFFLLTQHADADPAFQRRVLQAARQILHRHPEALPKVMFAYLTDRVRLADGKKQVYGTQARIQDGKVVLSPVEDPATLDQRRARVALGPEKHYLALLEKTYGGMGRQHAAHKHS